MSEQTDKLKKFVLERTKPDQTEQMTQLIDEVSQRHDQNKLDTVYLMSIVPKAMGMIKPEAMGEVKAALDKFRKK
ncbi:hypothetical protein ACNAN0_11260 [Agrilactobacillus fermenti]|uniref:hypothetical protein n=1 Tax=Agrilactobacillus fermenti TaxID=2586909 RepID=UPI003A5BD16D